VAASGTCSGPGTRCTCPETCQDERDTAGHDEPLPNIITNMATTDASVPDAAVTTPIHEDLARRDLLPDERLVDSGYPSADLLVESADRYGIALVTPMLADVSAQARAGGGYQAAAFDVDFDTRQVTCPQGQPNVSCSPAPQRGTEVIVVKIDTDTCQSCPVRERCVSGAPPPSAAAGNWPYAPTYPPRHHARPRLPDHRLFCKPESTEAGLRIGWSTARA
jgi:hypothetical protein